MTFCILYVIFLGVQARGSIREAKRNIYDRDTKYIKVSFSGTHWRQWVSIKGMKNISCPYNLMEIV
jgi:hypothetical protein